MKKTFFMLMAAMLMVASVSCKKDQPTNDDNDNNNDDNIPAVFSDGVFNPAMKITKYHYWDEWNQSKKLEQLFNWNNGLLQSIDHYDNGSDYVSWTEDFTYQSGKIIKVDDYGNSESVEFSYNSNSGNLTKITSHSNGMLAAEMQFTYGGNDKVSQIDFVNYNGGRRHPKGVSERFTYNLVWSGENITRLTITSENEEEAGVISVWKEEFQMSYDSHENPRRGCLSFAMVDCEMEDIVSYYCKNNLMKYTYSISNGYIEDGQYTEIDNENGENKFTYQYNNGFPVMIKKTRVLEDGGSYSVTHYCEY